MSLLFAKGTSPEKIVKTIILVLKAKNKSTTRHLLEALENVPPDYIEAMCAYWVTIRETEPETKALALLTQRIQSGLESLS